jgi:hypothetical protein
MIQRVQSLYLLLITVLMSFLLIRPYADLTLDSGESLLFRAHAVIMTYGNDLWEVYRTSIPVVLLALITGLISFCTIFFYNQRNLQIKICLLNAILIIILIALMLVYYLTIRHNLDVVRITFRIAMIYPVLSLIFCMLAVRAIRRDEILVNSYNRLR